jgi:hypothetical protein
VFRPGPGVAGLVSSDVIAARVNDYSPRLLDKLVSIGEEWW